MAQSIIIAAGTTAASSAQRVIPAGVAATYCIYASTGAVQPDMSADIVYDTAGGDVGIASLNVSVPVVQIQGPATIIVNKQVSATACAVVEDA